MALKNVEEVQVQPNDQVCYIPVYPKNGHPEEWEILTVAKVTEKAGQIVTTDGRRFERDGMEIGGQLSPSGSRATIHTFTNELRTRITRAKRIKFFSEYRWDALICAAPSTCDALLEEVVAVFQKYQITVE
jgi:hypothetical protein